MVRVSMTKYRMPVSEITRPSLERQLKSQICEIGRRMYDRGLVVACEGNVSARLDSNRILVTPARVDKLTSGRLDQGNAASVRKVDRGYTARIDSMLRRNATEKHRAQIRRG
jgi:hypothetical protein